MVKMPSDRDTPKREENLKVQMEINALENKKQTNKLENKMQQKNRKQNRAARVEELLHLFSKCACVNAIYFVPVCTSTYHMEHNKT